MNVYREIKSLKVWSRNTIIRAISKLVYICGIKLLNGQILTSHSNFYTIFDFFYRYNDEVNREFSLKVRSHGKIFHSIFLFDKNRIVWIQKVESIRRFKIGWCIISTRQSGDNRMIIRLSGGNNLTIYLNLFLFLHRTTFKIGLYQVTRPFFFVCVTM